MDNNLIDLNLVRVHTLLEKTLEIIDTLPSTPGTHRRRNITQLKAGLRGLEADGVFDYLPAVQALDETGKHHTLWLLETMSDDEPDGNMSQEELARATFDGDMVGIMEKLDSVNLARPVAEAALYDMGSDPGFLYPDWEDDEGE